MLFEDLRILFQIQVFNMGHNEAQLSRSNFLYHEMRLRWQIVWPYSDIRYIWAASCNICRGSRNRTSAPCPRDLSRRWRWTAPWTMMAVVAVVAVAAGPAIADAPVARTGTTPRPSHRSGPAPARFARPNAWNPSSFPRFFEDHFAPLKTSLFMVSLCCQFFAFSRSKSALCF